jgi:hypothetical protein
LLLGKLRLKRAHATNPQRRFHELLNSGECLVTEEGKGCAVYTLRRKG